MGKFPDLMTERLQLRELSEDDVHEIFALRSDPGVNKYISREKPQNIGDAKLFIDIISGNLKDNRCFYWAIAMKNNPFLIGTIGLWNFSEDKTVAELGYELLPAYHGKGIMHEAVKCVVQYIFEVVAVKKIEANSHWENAASIRLLQKNGFLPQAGKKDDENLSTIVYFLSRDSFLQNEKSLT